MDRSHKGLVLALVLYAAVAGSALAGSSWSADQPQQVEVAAAAGKYRPAADQAREQLANPAAKPAAEQSASGGDGAAAQPQPQADLPAANSEPGVNSQAEAPKRVYTAEQLAELQQQIQHAIDLQRNHEQVGAHSVAASPC